jgi:integrase
MFCNSAGRHLNPESLSQLFDRLQRAMPELTRIRFHDLRHTHASLLVMDGVPVKVVSERLGHANVAFTMHTYQHLLAGMSAAAARQFAALLNRSRPVDVCRARRRETPGHRAAACRPGRRTR